MDSPLRVGVVGLGQGEAHVRGFQYAEGSQVVALCALEEDELKQVARRFDVPLLYNNYEQMLEEADLDVVVIATPDHLHARQAMQALSKGKHVLSEIPMATTLQECEQMIELVEETGLKYQMGNQVRYAPCVVHIKSLVDDGTLGDIFYGEGEYLHNTEEYYTSTGRGWEHWRTDSTIPQRSFTGGGMHAIDTLRWLMKGRFVEVQGYGGNFVYKQVPGKEDLSVALFRTERGSIAKVLTSGGIQRTYCLYYSVYGTQGSVERNRIQDFFGVDTTNYLYLHDQMWQLRNMIPVPVYNWTDPLIKERSSHGTMEIAQAMDFVKAILTDRQPLVNVYEAARSSAAAIMALQAIDRHECVTIPTFSEKT